MAATSKKISIEKRKLLLTEGEDAYYFMIWACPAFRIDEEIQVMNFGGISELESCLQLLKNVEGFDDLESLVIARDAEQDESAAIKSVKMALAKVELPVPAQPFEFHDTETPKTAFMLFPGPNVNDIGALEDLCLATVRREPLLECVHAYIKCAMEKGENWHHKHKKQIHCYLAGKDKFVGMKIGEAARAGAWNWKDKALAPFKEIIQGM